MTASLSPRNQGIMLDALGPFWRSLSAEEVVAELDRIMDEAAKGNRNEAGQHKLDITPGGGHRSMRKPKK